jgi:hypothetical protein
LISSTSQQSLNRDGADFTCNNSIFPHCRDDTRS